MISSRRQHEHTPEVLRGSRVLIVCERKLPVPLYRIVSYLFVQPQTDFLQGQIRQGDPETVKTVTVLCPGFLCVENSILVADVAVVRLFVCSLDLLMPQGDDVLSPTVLEYSRVHHGSSCKRHCSTVLYVLYWNSVQSSTALDCSSSVEFGTVQYCTVENSTVLSIDTCSA